MASSRIHLLLYTISVCCASVVLAKTVNETGHVSSEEGGEESYGGEKPPEVEVVELRFVEIEVIFIVVAFIMATVLAKIGEYPLPLRDCEYLRERAELSSIRLCTLCEYNVIYHE